MVGFCGTLRVPAGRGHFQRVPIITSAIPRAKLDPQTLRTTIRSDDSWKSILEKLHGTAKITIGRYTF